MINKKQRAKLKKKLAELGVDDYLIYPVRDGYRLRISEHMFLIPDHKNGLTKTLMEGILDEVKQKRGAL